MDEGVHVIYTGEDIYVFPPNDDRCLSVCNALVGANLDISHYSFTPEGWEVRKAEVFEVAQSSGVRIHDFT